MALDISPVTPVFHPAPLPTSRAALSSAEEPIRTLIPTASERAAEAAEIAATEDPGTGVTSLAEAQASGLLSPSTFQILLTSLATGVSTNDTVLSVSPGGIPTPGNPDAIRAIPNFYFPTDSYVSAPTAEERDYQALVDTVGPASAALQAAVAYQNPSDNGVAGLASATQGRYPITVV